MLPDQWQKLTLGDIAAKNFGMVDGPFGSNLPASLYTPGGIPVIRGGNLSLGQKRFNDSGFVYVSDETANRLERSWSKPKDIVFTKKGTLGQTGIVPDDIGYSRFLISSNQMKLTVDTDVADPLYVYYYVSSPDSREKIIRESTASGVPKINLTYLRKFPVFLPPLPEQRAIARVLGALDDKIELNRRMSQTLEAMAQALFKSWFVDFEFKDEGGRVKDEAPEFVETGDDDFPLIPKGWKLSPLSAIAKYENGLPLQKFRPDGTEFLPVIKIRELRQGFANENSEQASPNIKPSCILDDGDMVFSWSGSLMIDLWCGGKGALNQHLFKVTSEKYPKWFYYFWTIYHLPDFQNIAEGKATTMGHIQRHHLDSARTIVPPDDVLLKADKLIRPLMDLVVKNRVQSRTLASLRDGLLPRLLSGELRVAQRLENG